jgi:hypothetical protein
MGTQVPNAAGVCASDDAAAGSAAAMMTTIGSCFMTISTISFNASGISITFVASSTCTGPSAMATGH